MVEVPFAVGDWYEFNPTTGVATVYYPFNGQAIAMKQGANLSNHDAPLGLDVVNVLIARAFRT